MCIVVCPKKNIHVSEQSNRNGYFPAECGEQECSGCAMCAIICPEAVIEVYTDGNTVNIKEAGGKTHKISLPKEEAKKLTAK